MLARRYQRHRRGSVIVSILIITVFLEVVVAALIVLANSNISRARGRLLLLEAQYAAESGADAAIALLNNTSDAYTGTGSTDTVLLTHPQYRASYSVSVTPGSTLKERIITSTGKLYTPANAATPSFSRKIEVTAQRSSSSGSYALAARNIIYIDSGVKNLQARDVYANGFIQMNKSTTNLIAENITVADKNTGANNCSIGGSGNLLKPSSFTTPGQTKTKITTAYNNCINPPGNSSNANFDVLANQINVAKIASTYIPWSQYMDASYSAAGSCNDIILGAFPRNLPAVSGSKATHYPDNGSGISPLCGAVGDEGDLTLGNGQYNINDNLHIRANLCLRVACDISLYNPSASIKWIFVEGAVNFSSLQTVAGSGPIVMVVYGSDPLTQVQACPYGGAAYLGNSGTTKAPALYLLAMNGLCVDKTKFGGSPALGGLSGKNIFIASNPGTPFDLSLDPLFPANQVPIDLAWRAIRYRRL